MRSLPPDDDGELPPGDAVFDVQPPQLTGDGRVLLGGVRRAPCIDAHRPGCTVWRHQLDVRGAREDLRESQRGHRRRALEREDVRLRVRRDDEVVRSQRPDERLLGERGVVIIVDEQMGEERRIRRCRRRLGSADQRREVDDPVGVQHVKVPPVETS